MRWVAVVASLAMLVSTSGPVTSPAGASSRRADPAAIAELVKEGEFMQLEGTRLGVPNRSSSSLIAAQRAASRLDFPAVERALARFRRYRDRKRRDLAVAACIDADASFAVGGYRRAWRAAVRCRSLRRELGDERGVTDAAQSAAIARILASEAPQSLSRSLPFAVPSRHDAAGLTRIEVKIDGNGQSMVVDTGANLSVLSESAATRLGVRMVQGAGAVSGAAATVRVRIAIADQLEFGGLLFRRVPFLVLRDADLDLPLPGGYRIDGILGFPLFRQSGGAFFGPGATFTGVAPPLKAAGVADLRMSGSDLFAGATVAGYLTYLHLDTGAAGTDLPAAFLARHPGLLAGAKRRRGRVAGAGGSKEVNVARLNGVLFRLGSSDTVATDIDATTADEAQSKTSPGTLGQDVLARWSWWGVDLRRMKLLTGPPMASSRGG